MTIPSGAPTITVPANWWTFSPLTGVTATVTVTYVAGAQQFFINVAELKPSDGQYYLVKQWAIDGLPSTADGGLVAVFNYCAVSGRTDWTAADATLYCQTVPLAIVGAQVKKWMVEKLMTEVNQELAASYPGGASADPANAGGLLDLITAFLRRAVVTNQSPPVMSHS